MLEKPTKNRTEWEPSNREVTPRPDPLPHPHTHCASQQVPLTWSITSSNAVSFLLPALPASSGGHTNKPYWKRAPIAERVQFDLSDSCTHAHTRKHPHSYIPLATHTHTHNMGHKCGRWLPAAAAWSTREGILQLVGWFEGTLHIVGVLAVPGESGSAMMHSLYKVIDDLIMQSMHSL